MVQRILVIGPKDSAERINRVAHALAARRPGLVAVTPAQMLAGERPWPDAYHLALHGAAAVVCVPRPDASIGNGTLHDLVHAHQMGVAVRVVCPRGRLLALDEAGLEVIPKPRVDEANAWKKRAASFSWKARALPQMFGGPGASSA